MSVFLGAIKKRKKQKVQVWKIFYKLSNGDFEYERIIDYLDFGPIIIQNKWRNENPKKRFFQIESDGFKTI